MASRLEPWPAVAVKALVIVPAAAAALVLTGAVPADDLRTLARTVRARLGALRGAAAP
jgi:hypothetical protein